MKDGHTLRENRRTQPLTEHRAFNNHDVVTEGWYPVCPARALKVDAARWFRIGALRVALYRGADGRVRALDAFCPHMGADLANGTVIGNELQCYFHQWRYDESGACTGTRCGEAPPRGARVTAYPVEERYGFLWIFSAPIASHPLPVCPGLDGCEVDAFHLGRVRLFAHHHAMMAGGIDLQHFASVHDLDVDFDLAVVDLAPGVAEWRLRGQLPARGWRSRLGRFATGGEVSYTLRVAGGSVAAITYGGDLRWRGRGRELPTLHILWGCTPTEQGPSEVDVFVLARRRAGLGRAATWALMGATAALLRVLKDDDIKAFPNMRFNPKNLVPADRSVARFIQYANRLAISDWSRAGADVVPLRIRRGGDGAP